MKCSWIFYQIMSDYIMKSGQYSNFSKLIGCLSQVLAAILKGFVYRFSKQKHMRVCSNLIPVEVNGVETQLSSEAFRQIFSWILFSLRTKPSVYPRVTCMFKCPFEYLCSCILVFTDIIFRFFLKAFLWKNHTNCSDLFWRRR